ncbi:hypothetical protein [Methanonatronarchaeum sp. AMET-Sl]|uniref:hypothetical protein n=1 Tax=Methanonatronarchaeum sp. AMET-Sl TaxID=3037654 RepID=UPI00244E01BA|nr:hypothetical protein [Methanonatronarchaeum sp. AMET-Sl]WGI17068.1 hypothetical protein QEN48_06095 [Methanonatronarchaeum sp. AMET-Sl]
MSLESLKEEKINHQHQNRVHFHTTSIHTFAIGHMNGQTKKLLHSGYYRTVVYKNISKTHN